MMILFSADVVIADVRQRAKYWRADEIEHLRRHNAPSARESRNRAAVLDQLAADLELQKAELARAS